MLPAGAVPLDHDFGRNVCGIDVNVRKQSFTNCGRDSRRRLSEIVLVLTRNDGRQVRHGR